MTHEEVLEYGNSAEALAQCVLVDIKKDGRISSATVLALDKFEKAKQIMQTVLDFAASKVENKLNS